MSTTERVRIGIIGCGRIAVKTFAPALAECENAELVAAASRDIERARSTGAKWVYDNYQALLDDERVEGVYIATHNGLHLPLAKAAFERGKHVLCEKPLANDAGECREMVAAAKAHQRVLLEAFMYRYHPRTLEAKRLIDAGAVGDVRAIEASFSFVMRAGDDVRFRRDWGGGGLLDVGCYCVNISRYFYGRLPRRVSALGTFHPQYDVDWALHGVLEFDEGRYAIISSGFDCYRSRVLVCGVDGTLDIPAAFGNRRDATQMTLDAKGNREVLNFDPAVLFRLEIEDFARAIRTGSRPLLAADDGYHNALVMDAMLASARDGGRAVEVPQA